MGDDCESTTKIPAVAGLLKSIVKCKSKVNDPSTALGSALNSGDPKQKLAVDALYKIIETIPPRTLELLQKDMAGGSKRRKSRRKYRKKKHTKKVTKKIFKKSKSKKKSRKYKK